MRNQDRPELSVRTGGDGLGPTLDVDGCAVSDDRVLFGELYRLRVQAEAMLVAVSAVDPSQHEPPEWRGHQQCDGEDGSDQQRGQLAGTVPDGEPQGREDDRHRCAQPGAAIERDDKGEDGDTEQNDDGLAPGPGLG